MLNRLQERHLRRTLKRGGTLELPAYQGRTVRVEVTAHRTFAAVTLQLQPGPFAAIEPYIGPAREVYPLVAEQLDALVLPQALEVAHG